MSFDVDAFTGPPAAPPPTRTAPARADKPAATAASDGPSFEDHLDEATAEPEAKPVEAAAKDKPAADKTDETQDDAAVAAAQPAQTAPPSEAPVLLQLIADAPVQAPAEAAAETETPPPALEAPETPAPAAPAKAADAAKDIAPSAKPADAAQDAPPPAPLAEARPVEAAPAKPDAAKAADAAAAQATPQTAAPAPAQPDAATLTQAALVQTPAPAPAPRTAPADASSDTRAAPIDADAAPPEAPKLTPEDPRGAKADAPKPDTPKSDAAAPACGTKDYFAALAALAAQDDGGAKAQAMPANAAALANGANGAQDAQLAVDAVAVARAAPAAAQVGREIIRRFNGDSTNFELRLDPPELGKVEVRLNVSRDHKVTAVVAAENPAALAELSRNARELQQALQSAGLELSDNGLSFDLKQQRESRADANERGDFGQGARAEDETQTVAASPSRPIGLQSWRGVRVDLVA